MFRTLTTIVFATLVSTTLLAQTPSDPVADMTSNIISRYLPQATSQGVSSTSFSSMARTAQTAAPITAAPATAAGTNVVATAPAATATASGVGFPGLFAPRTAIGLNTGTAAGGIAVSSGVGNFRSLSAGSMGLQLGQLGKADAKTTTAGFAASAPTAQAAGVALPVAIARPRSFSAASNNGIHAITAVVDTDKGPENVELKGDKDQVLKQLDLLSPQARQVMKQSLGIK